MMSLCHFRMEGNDEAVRVVDGFDTGVCRQGRGATSFGSGPSHKPFCLEPF